MKRSLILAAAAATLGTSIAVHAEVTHRELAKDRADVQKQREDLEDAKLYGSRHDVRKQSRQLREARQELREDRRDAYDAGLYTRPTGWRERAWANGDRLPAAYYGRTYWVEPARYGLAPIAVTGERWVRVDRDVVRIAPDGTVREVRRGWFR